MEFYICNEGDEYRKDAIAVKVTDGVLRLVVPHGDSRDYYELPRALVPGQGARAFNLSFLLKWGDVRMGEDGKIHAQEYSVPTAGS